MKNKITYLSFVLALSLMLPGYSVVAEEQEQVYGWELMTNKERNEHKIKMQNMKTEEERARYRMEHHKMMQARAEERGVKLPDEPQMRERMGGGPGMGGGAGMGGGKGR